MTAHTIIIEIAPDGKVTGEVKGVTGKQCGSLTKWLDEIGEVLEDKHTPDYFKDAKQTVTTGK
jgi:hypothetical protein